MVSAATVMSRPYKAITEGLYVNVPTPVPMVTHEMSPPARPLCQQQVFGETSPGPIRHGLPASACVSVGLSPIASLPRGPGRLVQPAGYRARAVHHRRRITLRHLLWPVGQPLALVDIEHARQSWGTNRRTTARISTRARHSPWPLHCMRGAAMEQRSTGLRHRSVGRHPGVGQRAVPAVHGGRMSWRALQQTHRRGHTPRHAASMSCRC